MEPEAPLRKAPQVPYGEQGHSAGKTKIARAACRLTLPHGGEVSGRIYLAYGVTSIRNPTGDPYEMMELRESIGSGRRIGPRIFGTGNSAGEFNKLTDLFAILSMGNVG